MADNKLTEEEMELERIFGDDIPPLSFLVESLDREIALEEANPFELDLVFEQFQNSKEKPTALSEAKARYVNL